MSNRPDGGYLSGPKPETGTPPKPRLFTRANPLMSGSTIDLADGRSVPTAAVAELDELERAWPGATLPQARPAIVAAVMAALVP